ncbi:MAG: YHS domain-containing protein [Desulfatitalea sp.]|nr:YHS domain-containing protein [Desulfatitalea sp.]
MRHHHDHSRPIDPVCGASVDPIKTTHKANYKGVERYFCTQGCKDRFESAPQDYIVTKRKGFWRRYLERLDKATGGKPPSCCS